MKNCVGSARRSKRKKCADGANRSKLIEDFHRAWIALDEAQIYVRYGEEWDDGVYLSKWDKFEFGD